MCQKLAIDQDVEILVVIAAVIADLQIEWPRPDRQIKLEIARIDQASAVG